MLTKTDKLFPHLETDDDNQKELVSLYNEWYKNIAFKSNWPTDDPCWKKMEKYCLKHKKLTKQFWMQLYEQYKEVGHFTKMLFKLFPNYLEVNGYCPLKSIEELWMISFIVKNSNKNYDKQRNCRSDS